MEGFGLEGVIAAETRLSEVDGERGRLILAGEDVETLAGRDGFEAVAGRLLGAAPALGQARLSAHARLSRLAEALALPDGMDALRAAVAQLPGETPPDDVIASVAVYAAAWWRRRAGLGPVEPDPSRSHAADYLRLVRGEPATAAEARALDAYFVTVIDHGFNSSTFAARVIASTGSDLVSAVVGAIGALKGPLHGGAPGPVLDMLDALGAPDQARASGRAADGAIERWLRAELDAGRRLMGMGHRIYRVRDPRAAVLERAIAELEAAAPARGRLSLARAVERAAERLLAERRPDRPLKANVEFYTAVLLEAVGLERALFSPTFAASRVAGWCAHVAEQRATGRLIRPTARYVGPRSTSARAARSG